MTDEEIAVALSGHSHEIKSLKHRADELEGQQRTTQELAVSVKELALNMRNMMEELKKQGTRLDMLEREPADRLRQIKTAIIAAIASGLVGIAIGAIVSIV